VFVVRHLSSLQIAVQSDNWGESFLFH
jgi:hypothetical protein